MKSATESSEQNAKGQLSAIPADQVRATLDKILASPGFVNADRLTRFLRHTVEETLEGQTDKLKESLLGIDVFGRKPTYDPRVDAVVRTEAVKLRARLRDYYETEGRDDPVRIDLPKGGYVPVFRIVEEPPESPPAVVADVAAAPAPAAWKQIAAALAVTLVLAGSVWIAARKGDRGDRAPELASIAVLPFEDLSSQHDQEYFCDGMTEEIIDALTKVGGFRVVARTSSFAFKGKQQDIREIGRMLNVHAVLEGSVRKFGDKLRVTAQLNSVADGYHLWSETYERELKDVFSVQDDISRAIVNTLTAKLASPRGPRGQVASANPENIETYDLYLKGRYHWARWRSDGAQKAIGYFEQAIAKDPGYAAAYAGLADSYAWLGFFGSLPPSVAMQKARQNAQKAIELDDSLAAAHTSLAYVKALYDFDWSGAGAEFQRAIDLNPGLAGGHFGYGIAYLAPMGKTNDCLREMKLARDLDPLSLATNTYVGLAYQLVGQTDEAMVNYRKALELDPTFFEARDHLAMMYCSRKMDAQFREELDQAQGPGIQSRVDLLRAFGDALESNRERALAAVSKWEHPPDGSYVRPTEIAMVYGALGDRERAIAWLQRAYANRDGMLVYSYKEQVYRPFRSDPRYKDLVHKLALPLP